MAPHVHTQTFRVAMAEVDVAQIHFTAVYRWMDRGFSEWLAEVGHPFTRILEEGPGVPDRGQPLPFLGRISLDDLLTLRTEIGGVGRTSFRAGTTVHAGRGGRRARGARARLREPGDPRAGARARTGCATRPLRTPDVPFMRRIAGTFRRLPAWRVDGSRSDPLASDDHGGEVLDGADELCVDPAGAAGGGRAAGPRRANPPPRAAGRRAGLVARAGGDAVVSGMRIRHALAEYVGGRSHGPLASVAGPGPGAAGAPAARGGGEGADGRRPRCGLVHCDRANEWLAATDAALRLGLGLARTPRVGAAGGSGGRAACRVSRGVDRGPLHVGGGVSRVVGEARPRGAASRGRPPP